jgi:hypothetical protein
MRDYDNILFREIVEQLGNEKQNVINIAEINSDDYLSLQYFLTRNYYYAVIIDDYPFEIEDSINLFEALYYQVKLITVHDYNWDAIQEGLGDVLNNFLEFNGVCLLFRNKSVKSKIPHELEKLTEIVEDINKQSGQKKIKIGNYILVYTK